MINRINTSFRININLGLSDGVLENVLELNSIIARDSSSKILFSKDSPPYPHITLLMGNVLSEDALKEIQDELSSFSRDVNPFHYHLTPPYLKKPSLHYIFSDIVPQDNLYKLRQRLYNKISSLILCDFYGGPDNPSHITIGYTSKVYYSLNELYGKFRNPEGHVETIRVSMAGDRGTCLEHLAQYPLTSRKDN